MALINCKECGKEISDKADRCPNCGCPVSYSVENREQEINHNEQKEWKPTATAETNKKQPKMKNSVLSLVAFLISFFGCGCISIVGTIIAIIDLKSNDKSKKHDLSVAAIIIMVVWWFLVILFFAYSDDSSNQTTTDDTTTEQAITQEDITTGNTVADGNEDVATESTTEIELTFDDKVKELLGEEPGNNILKILKDDIGFTELFDIEKVNDTLNYKVNANGYEIMITEISDTDFRVIIPNSDYVFYENGSVVLNYEEFQKRTINEDNIIIYFAYAEEMVEPCLKNSKSAKFCYSGDAYYKRYENIVEVRGNVTAKNDFNANVTENWVVQFMTDENASQYVPMYIKIGDNESGEYTELD